MPSASSSAGVLKAAELLDFSSDHAPRWTCTALSGRLVEVSGGHAAAHLTAAFGLVLETQLCGDQAGWVTLEQGAFFPPDVAAGGVDLNALPVVRVPTARAAGRAADHLVRSGGFGLVVIDLSDAPIHEQSGSLAVPMLTRLLGLAREHETAILLLTRKPAEMASINSLVSLRADAQWSACGGRYDVRIRVLKDKRGGPGWTHVEACRGPAGLR